MPGAALRSTAKDLLKYVSANLGLTSSTLTPLMEKTHASHFHAGLETDTGRDTDIGLAWMITHKPGGANIIQHGGLTDGFIAFACFDPSQRRGVVVLCNSQDFNVPVIGRLLLESEWQSNWTKSSFAKIFDQLPKAHEPAAPRIAIQVDRKLLDACVGRYEFATNAAFPAGAKMTIWREGDQLVGQAWGQNTLQGAFDIYPESETNFFLKINGAHIHQERDRKSHRRRPPFVSSEVSGLRGEKNQG